MSGDKMHDTRGGPGAEYGYKQPAAGGPPGYGGQQSAAGAPPAYGTQPTYAQPQYEGGSIAYPQWQQKPTPNVVYGVPPAAPTTAYGYPQQQPVGAPPMQWGMAPLEQWTTGLFDCGEDPTNAVITCLVPCITFGQVAEVVDEGTTSCILAASVWMAVLLCLGVPCCVSCLWRTKLRAKYNLPKDEIDDFCVHCWCETCALCQEYRELKNRGLDPTLGWEYHRQQLYAQSMQQRPMDAPQQGYMQR